MPFDYEEYERKCKTLPPEALQKEWENYTRQMAGGATSASLSVLFAPVTAGVSTLGIGLSAPRIHNARKKREIIEAQLQAHGTTHHTRKRDVIAPMAISGGLGGLTLGLAGHGADMIAGAAVGHGVEYVVSHAALETVAATLEHGHVTHKKTKEELKIVQKYGVSYESKLKLEDGMSYGYDPPRYPSRIEPRYDSKLKLEDGMSYGYDPKKYPSRTEPRYESIPVPPPYSASPLNQQQSSQYQAQSKPDLHQSPTSTMSQQEQARLHTGAMAQNNKYPPTTEAPLLKTQPVQANIQLGNKQTDENREDPQKGPFGGLPDDAEAEARGLHWDASRGMYVRAEHRSTPLTSGYEQLQPSEGRPNGLQDLMPQLLIKTLYISQGASRLPQAPQISVEESNDQTRIQKLDSTHEEQFAQLQQYFPPPPPLASTDNSNGTLLSLSGNLQGQAPSLLNIQSANPSILPPRPHSSLENFEYLPGLPPRPHSSLHNRPDQLPYPLPPPPLPQPQGYQPQTPQGQYHTPVPVRPQQVPLAQYSLQPYSPQQYTPSLSQTPYQSFPPQLPPAPQAQPGQNHLERPGLQPLQQVNKHRDSISSISTVSSCSSIFSASTVSAATTPLTNYSKTTQSFYNPSSSRIYGTAGQGVCASPQQQYPPPPPTNVNMATMAGKQRDYSSQLYP